MLGGSLLVIVDVYKRINQEKSFSAIYQVLTWSAIGESVSLRLRD